MNAQKAGAAEAKAYNASLQKMTIGAKAASVAMKGLALAGNVIGSIVMSVAIEKITEGISGIANYEKNLASAAKSASEAFGQTESDLDSYKSRVTELQAILTDHSSTVEEVTDAKQQLLDIQNELVDKYGSEASGIDLVNGSLAVLFSCTLDAKIAPENQMLFELYYFVFCTEPFFTISIS